MAWKLDRFTWGVIGVVAVLLLAAVISVSWTGGRGWGQATYLEEDTPSAPVYNAFVALQQGDLFKAREQYSRRILEEADKEPGYGPLSSDGYRDTNSARRLRILSIQPDPNDPGRALVTFEVDTYTSGGLFGGGSTWTRRGTVEVIREDGRWKINAMEFFY